MPEDVEVPPIWLLGSSDYSAELAASVGMGFAFAHHFAHHDAGRRDRPLPRGLQALGLARAALRDPRDRRGRAETEAEAERLAATLDFNYVRRAQGEYRPLVSPEEALAYPYSAGRGARAPRQPRAPLRRHAGAAAASA